MSFGLVVGGKLPILTFLNFDRKFAELFIGLIFLDRPDEYPKYWKVRRAFRYENFERILSCENIEKMPPNSFESRVFDHDFHFIIYV